jgi:protein-S-isoprenylcysteine O-methyltransferase Ste14
MYAHNKQLQMPLVCAAMAQRYPSRFLANLLTLPALALAIYITRQVQLPAHIETLLVLLITLLPMMLTELFWQKSWKEHGQRWSWRAVQARRLVYKCLGLAACVSAIAVYYWLWPEYEHSRHRGFFLLLQELWPWLLGLGLVYVVLMDGLLNHADDIYSHIGRYLCRQATPPQTGELVQLGLALLVKAFFLPLMFGFLQNNIEALQTRRFDWDWMLGEGFYPNVQIAWYSLDLAIATLGYSLSLKLFDSQVRSTEPTALGWMVALACYPPFADMVFTQLQYESGRSFGEWLAPWPWLQAVWGGVILLLLGIYALSTVAFGLRFSNLTHRGIIREGPYRWCKHPAYLSKNLMWWMIAMPFVPLGTALEALRLCCMLLLVNALYFWRARTEEQHLSADPEYRSYCEWIAEHGLWARLKRFGGRRASSV